MNLDESFTKKNDKKLDIKLESMKQDTIFSVGSKSCVVERRWIGTVR